MPLASPSPSPLLASPISSALADTATKIKKMEEEEHIARSKKLKRSAPRETATQPARETRLAGAADTATDAARDVRRGKKKEEDVEDDSSSESSTDAEEVNAIEEAALLAHSHPITISANGLPAIP